jgi:hypothetical protein
MIRMIALPAALAGLALVAGCVEEGTTSASGVPSRAAQACLQAVTAQTNNPDVVLLQDGTFSEAGTRVLVGVGESRAPWECFAYSDGSTGGITFLGNEGTL